MKPALLVIDVQKEFFKFSPTTAQSLNNAIEYIPENIKFVESISDIISYGALKKILG
jgi:nicotinamidase-related amidase